MIEAIKEFFTAEMINDVISAAIGLIGVIIKSCGLPKKAYK